MKMADQVRNLISHNLSSVVVTPSPSLGTCDAFTKFSD